MTRCLPFRRRYLDRPPRASVLRYGAATEALDQLPEMIAIAIAQLALALPATKPDALLKWRPLREQLDGWVLTDNFAVTVGDASGPKFHYTHGNFSLHTRVSTASTSKWPLAMMVVGLVKDGTIRSLDARANEVRLHARPRHGQPPTKLPRLPRLPTPCAAVHVRVLRVSSCNRRSDRVAAAHPLRQWPLRVHGRAACMAAHGDTRASPSGDPRHPESPSCSCQPRFPTGGSPWLPTLASYGSAD